MEVLELQRKREEAFSASDSKAPTLAKLKQELGM